MPACKPLVSTSLSAAGISERCTRFRRALVFHFGRLTTTCIPSLSSIGRKLQPQGPLECGQSGRSTSLAYLSTPLEHSSRAIKFEFIALAHNYSYLHGLSFANSPPISRRPLVKSRRHLCVAWFPSKPLKSECSTSPCDDSQHAEPQASRAIKFEFIALAHNYSYLHGLFFANSPPISRRQLVKSCRRLCVAWFPSHCLKTGQLLFSW